MRVIPKQSRSTCKPSRSGNNSWGLGTLTRPILWGDWVDLYRRQGRYAEAEPLYLQALQIREQLLGPEHPDVATSLNGLANLYRNQGKDTQAEPLYLRALHIQEQMLEPLHPDVAFSFCHLADIYRD